MKCSVAATIENILKDLYVSKDRDPESIKAFFMHSRQKKDMIGLSFGLLTVTSEVNERNKNGHILYNVVCCCGNRKKVLGSSLRSGKSKSCNDCRYKINGIHGKHKTIEFKTWSSMIYRCNPKNKNNPKFKNYAGKGISVCERWLSSFTSFLEDMGKRPSSNYSLDRIDVNKGYSKENCRWTDAKTQSRNKTNNVFLEHKGDIRCFSEWCEIKKIKTSTLKNRLLRGWSVEKSLETPVRSKSKKNERTA